MFVFLSTSSFMLLFLLCVVGAAEEGGLNVEDDQCLLKAGRLENIFNPVYIFYIFYIWVLRGKSEPREGGQSFTRN